MAKTNKKTFPFVLLDGSILTNGLRVNIDGVDTSQYERNPVVFYTHNDESLPIGRAQNIRKENGQILIDVEPDYEDTDPEVQRIIGKLERGFLNMISAGLADLDFSDDPSFKLPGQFLPTAMKSRLRESSIVPIGGNHNALRLYDNEGVLLDNDLKLADFIKPKFENKMNKELLQLLNLSDTATEEQINAAVKAVMAENVTLKADKAAMELRDKEARKNKYIALLDTAVKDARIDAKGKENFILLFDSNAEAAEAALNAIPARQSVVQKIEDNGQKGALELADLEKQSWEQLDKANKLMLLKDKYPDLYAEKFKAKYGKEPN